MQIAKRTEMLPLITLPAALMSVLKITIGSVPKSGQSEMRLALERAEPRPTKMPETGRRRTGAMSTLPVPR